MEVKTICVYGAGLMGHGIAQVCAASGYTVYLRDRAPEYLDKAMGSIKKTVDKLVSKEKISEADGAAMLERIKPTMDDAEALQNTDFVIEAVFEDLDIKKETFALFDKLCPELYNDLSKFGHVCSLPRDFGIDILVTLPNKDRKYIQQIDDIVLGGPLKEFIWQIGEDTLPEYVLKKATEKGVKFGTAESCTGGLVASILTDVPGSSKAFQGGVVTYSNQTKMDLLGVSEETLKAQGAVSEDTAKEMAIGALKVLDADIAVALTGISGPDGGTEEKPVGTVCIGLAKGDRAISRRYHVRGDRRKIKNKFAHLALFQILEELI